MNMCDTVSLMAEPGTPLELTSFWSLLTLQSDALKVSVRVCVLKRDQVSTLTLSSVDSKAKATVTISRCRVSPGQAITRRGWKPDKVSTRRYLPCDSVIIGSTGSET